MGSIFGGGGGGNVQAVKPPKPLQVNLPQMQSEMTAADQAAYAAADQYNNAFYPALTQGRDQMIGQAYQNLTGPLNPSLENTFVNAGNMGSINSLGGGDQGFGLSKGSLARNAAAASVATNEQGFQDYNQNLFQTLNNIWAPRSFGMTPEDAANIYTFNNTQMNNYLQQKFAAQTQAYYANQGQAAASGAAGTSAIAGILSAVIQGAAAASDRRLKTDIEQVGVSRGGIPMFVFRYKGGSSKFIGTLADEVEKIVPEAVSVINGFKFVDYSKIDVPFRRIT